MDLKSQAIREFLRMKDTPASFSGKGGDIVRVNSAEDALEFMENPYFSVNKGGTNQTGIVTNTYTKLTWSTESMDEGGYFSLANNRFDAPEGKFLFFGQITLVNLADTKVMTTSLYKNGARVAEGLIAPGRGGTACTPVVSIGESDGDDYFELYAWHNEGSDNDVFGAVQNTFFGGHRIG